LATHAQGARWRRWGNGRWQGGSLYGLMYVTVVCNVTFTKLQNPPPFHVTRLIFCQTPHRTHGSALMNSCTRPPRPAKTFTYPNYSSSASDRCRAVWQSGSVVQNRWQLIQPTHFKQNLLVQWDSNNQPIPSRTHHLTGKPNQPKPRFSHTLTQPANQPAKLTSNIGCLGSSSMLRSCSMGVLDGRAGVGSTL
jgi:hypothetical protein